MPTAVSNFIRSESGAVSVDWVVLTAAVVGLGLGVATAVSLATNRVTAETATEMAQSSDLSDLAAGTID